MKRIALAMLVLATACAPRKTYNQLCYEMGFVSGTSEFTGCKQQLMQQDYLVQQTHSNNLNNALMLQGWANNMQAKPTYRCTSSLGVTTCR